jgi:hypothetical protein
MHVCEYSDFVYLTGKLSLDAVVVKCSFGPA